VLFWHDTSGRSGLCGLEDTGLRNLLLVSYHVLSDYLLLILSIDASSRPYHHHRWRIGNPSCLKSRSPPSSRWPQGNVYLKSHHLFINLSHFQKWGVTLFVLYFAQCGLGAFIHWVKPKNSTRRPAQNYLHAVFGLLIIGLALYQVHSGYHHEWPKTTGRGEVPRAVHIVWVIWAVVSRVFTSVLRDSFLQEPLRARVVVTCPIRHRFSSVA